MRRFQLPVLMIAVLLVSAGADWSQFRGPSFNGSSSETDLPVKFSQTQNVKWSARLPGPSAATPIVHGNHVFVSSVDKGTNELLALCFDRVSGKQLWKKTVAKGIRQDIRSYLASPSPATDGELVYFFYGSGDLVAFDFSGKLAWKQNIQKEYGTFAFQWTFSTSPLLYGDKLYMQVLQRDTAVGRKGFQNRMNESYLLALDPKTGRKLWRHVRPSKAKAESREAFSTPVPFEFNGRKEILVVGGDDITGHDAETGKELWRWGTWNPQRIGHWRLVPSPVAGGGVVLACAPKGGPINAVKAGGNGQLGDDSIAWNTTDKRQLSTDVPTPAFYEGDFFVLSASSKTISRVDSKTGQIKWQSKAPGRTKYEASPMVADGKVHIVNFDGDVSIIDAGSGDVLNTVKMDAPEEDNCRASISAAGGNLFIRTTSKLFCIGD